MPKIDPIISATMQTKRIITTATQPPAAIAAAMPLTAATVAFTAAIVAYIAIFINFTEAFAATFATLIDFCAALTVAFAALAVVFAVCFVALAAVLALFRVALAVIFADGLGRAGGFFDFRMFTLAFLNLLRHFTMLFRVSRIPQFPILFAP